MVKALNSLSKGPVLKTIGDLRGRLSFSSFQGRSNCIRGILGNLVVKSKLLP